MKNFVKIINLNNTLKVDKALTLEEYGFIYYLILNNDEIGLNDILIDLDINMEKLKNITQSLMEKDIIEVNMYTNEYVSVVWEITFKIDKEVKTSVVDYGDVFILTESQKNALSEVDDQRELFIRLYKIYESTMDSYNLDKPLTINSSEDYEEYLRTYPPIHILHNNRIKPTIKEVNLIFNLIYKNNVDINVLSFLIDYVITTSIYNNLSIEYLMKILSNWQRNNIYTLEDAMAYVKNKKEAIEERHNTYKEPEWEQEEMKVLQEDLDEIEKMLKNK